MKNRILSIIAGLVAGWLVVYFGEMATHNLFPPPANINLTDKEALKHYIQNMPTLAFVSILIVWALSVFTGGLVSGKFAKSGWQRVCLTTGAILLAGSIVNLFMIPHPIWVVIISIIMYLPLSYLGGRLINKFKTTNH